MQLAIFPVGRPLADYVFGFWRTPLFLPNQIWGVLSPGQCIRLYRDNKPAKAQRCTNVRSFACSFICSLGHLVKYSFSKKKLPIPCILCCLFCSGLNKPKSVLGKNCLCDFVYMKRTKTDIAHPFCMALNSACLKLVLEMWSVAAGKASRQTKPWVLSTLRVSLTITIRVRWDSICLKTY